MKVKNILIGALVCLSLSSCLDQLDPTSVASENQVKQADKSALSNGLAAYMTNMSGFSSINADCGFASFLMQYDVMAAELPIYKTGYDYFWYFPSQQYLGAYTYSQIFWVRYYALVKNCNNLINACDISKPEEHTYLGNAYIYRAMCYLDMGRLYEYRQTGTAKDAIAEERGIYGLTVPLVTEFTTEEQGRNNPRVPFWHLYRFIFNDLNLAEKYLVETPVAASKQMGSRSVAYGLKARLWLEIATRCERFPDDLNNLISHDNDAALASLPKIAISSAQEAYANAAKYARLAIDCGYTPTSESEWFNPSSGFNTPNNAWMWCITVAPSTDAANAVWQSYASFLSPEVTWGISTTGYNGYRMIDAALFATIEDADWRKTTWIAPEDARNKTAFQQKYARGTALSFDEWKEYAPYAGFKYHPAQGDRNTSNIGNCISTPLMRVEEMYFIEAEAVAHSQGVAAGEELLKNFVGNYRYANPAAYTFHATDIDVLDREIFRQKRIEFWGEGLMIFDYNRHGYAVVRGYSGTNHPEQYRYNSNEGFVAPWSILYIPNSTEAARNEAIISNPDMSGAISTLWSGN